MSNGKKSLPILLARMLRTSKFRRGKFLSFKSGQMSFNGEEIEDNELRCVIVGWAYHNAYYDPSVRYDPKNPQSPLCYATATSEEELVPHEEAPEKQASACLGCPLNEFGTAATGRGKACKNGIRLALIAEDDMNDPSSAEVVYAAIPTKSIKNWLIYVTRELRDKVGRPSWAVVTSMKCTPDAESQFKITFRNEELIENSKLFDPLEKLWESTMEGIDFPYQKQEKVEKPKKGKPQKFARR